MDIINVGIVNNLTLYLSQCFPSMIQETFNIFRKDIGLSLIKNNLKVTIKWSKWILLNAKPHINELKKNIDQPSQYNCLI